MIWYLFLYSNYKSLFSNYESNKNNTKADLYLKYDIVEESTQEPDNKHGIYFVPSNWRAPISVTRGLKCSFFPSDTINGITSIQESIFIVSGQSKVGGYIYIAQQDYLCSIWEPDSLKQWRLPHGNLSPIMTNSEIGDQSLMLLGCLFCFKISTKISMF